MDINKFIVFPGNNHNLIKKALQKRKVWAEIPEEEILAANFIWKPLNLSSRIYHEFDQKLKFSTNYQILINHFENNSVITTKSGLTKSLKYFYTHQENIFNQNYHVFQSIPTTFIVQAHKQTLEYKSFVQRFKQIEKKNFHKEKVPEKHCQNNVWIVKPEAENQGKGIELFKTLKDIDSFLLSKPDHTNWIIQKCIQKPLLYYGRKFDIRMWVLVTPQFQIYYYNKAYMRTSSYEYDSSNLVNVVQLTNNCFQKKTQNYSKHQQGNTLPIQKLQQYLNQHEKYSSHKIDIQTSIIQRMKDLILDSLLCAKKNLYKPKRQKEFQLFGYDFLIDEDLRTWLLQVNNNPYLGVPNNYIKNLLPIMVDEMFQLILDPIFPPSQEYQKVQTRCFTLIYTEVNLLSRRLKNQRILTKNYYPIPTNTPNGRPVSISKISRTDEFFQPTYAGSEREMSKQKYSTPVETIKYLLDTYFYSDFQPFELPVSMILGSQKLLDLNQLQNSLKSLKLITETRISPILIESRFIEISQKILVGDYHQKIKATLLNGYVNGVKTAKDRKKLIEALLPSISKNLIDKIKQKQTIDESYLINSIRVIICLGGIFQRKVFIPGETRQNQYAREFFIRQNGLLFLLFVSKLHPDLCKSEITNFLNSLEDKDWQIFRNSAKLEQNELMGWEKKYKGNSIMKSKEKKINDPNLYVMETLKAQIKFEQLETIFKNKGIIQSTTPLMKARKSLVLPQTLIKDYKNELPSIKGGKKIK